MTNPLMKSDIQGYPVRRGKVRDVYDLGDKLLIVATDRLSAFDVVFEDPIPDKGRILTSLSVWWFRKTSGLVPNHFITADFEEFPRELHAFREQLEGRSMLVRKAEPFAAEFIVRGYLDGSAYKSYEETHHICGIAMLAGLRRRDSFGTALFTPTTKAEEGHDRPMDYAELVTIVGEEAASTGREFARALYTYAHNLIYDHGLIISDTKFEFGIDGTTGELILIDEILTPDSSRYWLKESYHPDSEKAVSLDKQYVRDYVEEIGWEKAPPAPQLPEDVVRQTTERYRRTYEIVTGEAFG